MSVGYVILLKKIIEKYGMNPLFNYTKRAEVEVILFGRLPFKHDIHDEERMIDPLPDQPRCTPSEVTKIADNILLFQKNNGGWPKNYDMRAILTEEQKTSVMNGKNETNTTFEK